MEEKTQMGYGPNSEHNIFKCQGGNRTSNVKIPLIKNSAKEINPKHAFVHEEYFALCKFLFM